MIEQSGKKLVGVVTAVVGVFLLSLVVANAQESCSGATQPSSADKSVSATIKPTSFATASSGTAPTETSSARTSVSATIKVTGMTCGGCAKSVEPALSRVDGVREAKLSYECGIAEVTYDESKVTLDQ